MLWCRMPLVVVCLLLSAATGVHGKALYVRSLAEIRQEGVVVQKWDASCGAAALATLLTYDLNDPMTERAIATAMLRQTGPIRVRARGGFSLLNMQEFAEARGYDANGYGGMSFNDLLNFIPSIVPVKFHGYDHFVVVRAVRDGEVVFADPAYGRRTMSIADFDRAWEQKLVFAVRRPAQ
jgi:uncharacterized protein